MDLDRGIVRLIGKGDRERLSSLDPEAVKAIGNYVRRARLGRRRAVGLALARHVRDVHPSGIGQMVRDRAAGLGFKLHAHQLRHYRADRYLSRASTRPTSCSSWAGRTGDAQSLRGSRRRTDRALEAARRLADDDL